jgi:hypothetical protein
MRTIKRPGNQFPRMFHLFYLFIGITVTAPIALASSVYRGTYIAVAATDDYFVVAAYR